MGQYGWANVPQAIKDQVGSFVRALREELGENLIGVYLHGSLAMGCFNPRASDIDLLVRTRNCLAVEAKHRLAQLLLETSGAPSPIELSLVCEQDIRPWRYPTPYDLHYSEEWRWQYEQDLATGRWQQWSREGHLDEDLAAHITITHLRGICLWGAPIERAFPQIPPADYKASILSDVDWGIERIAKIPVYVVLNLCRIYAYCREEKILSKDEGGVWACEILPADLQPIIAKALSIYRGDSDDRNLSEAAVRGFAAYMKEKIRKVEESRQ